MFAKIISVLSLVVCCVAYGDVAIDCPDDFCKGNNINATITVTGDHCPDSTDLTMRVFFLTCDNVNNDLPPFTTVRKNVPVSVGISTHDFHAGKVTILVFILRPDGSNCDFGAKDIHLVEVTISALVSMVGVTRAKVETVGTVIPGPGVVQVRVSWDDPDIVLKTGNQDITIESTEECTPINWGNTLVYRGPVADADVEIKAVYVHIHGTNQIQCESETKSFTMPHAPGFGRIVRATPATPAVPGVSPAIPATPATPSGG